MRFSAGLLPYRRRGEDVQVFLVHMAGPYWAHKDDGSWSIAKGEYDPRTEDAWAVAQREFTEETGQPPPIGTPEDVGEYAMPSGKRVRVFAVETGEPLEFVSSNTFEMEWPAGSGILSSFPETDAAAWFDIPTARLKIVSGQLRLIEAFIQTLR